MTSRAEIRARTVGRRVRLADWLAWEHGATGEVIGVSSRGLTVRTAIGNTVRRVTAADIAAWLD